MSNQNDSPVDFNKGPSYPNDFKPTSRLKPEYNPEDVMKVVTRNLWEPSRVPCFRTSMLFGIGVGVTGIFTTFFFARRGIWAATNVGFGAFFLSSTAGWALCRYRLARKQQEIRNVVTALQKMEKSEKESGSSLFPLALDKEEQAQLSKIKSISITETLKKI